MSRIAATVFVLALATPSLAVAADAVGTTGAIAELEVNHSTAETFLQYHGRVVITDGTRATEYRWGGVACSNKALPEGLVTMLHRAMAAGTPVTPRYQAGQGSNRCLVGFTLTP
ncbi:MAG: hypothetical protein IPH80_31260 [Myxococcales bacterium]|jgi:hypothetical protein|nr:hypothetical protein [Myxococcales bacterium]